MKEVKKSFPVMMGRFIGNAMAVCVATCILSVLIALTYSFVIWVLRIGGII